MLVQTVRHPQGYHPENMIIIRDSKSKSIGQKVKTGIGLVVQNIIRQEDGKIA